MTSLGLGALGLGVRVLGGLGMVVVAALVAMAAYVDWAAWGSEESRELMDWTWYKRVARFIVIFLNAVNSATNSSLTSVLAFGNRTAQCLFAKESKYVTSLFRHLLYFSLMSVASRGEAGMKNT